MPLSIPSQSIEYLFAVVLPTMRSILVRVESIRPNRVGEVNKNSAGTKQWQRQHDAARIAPEDEGIPTLKFCFSLFTSARLQAVYVRLVVKESTVSLVRRMYAGTILLQDVMA